MNPNENVWGELEFLPRKFIMATLCTCLRSDFDGENCGKLVFRELAGKINRNRA
jgi:hypothetical protein